MKIPLVYPKIPNSSNFLPKKCIAFEKYDGTNLHWVWDQKDGCTHFGTRRDRYSLSKDGIFEFHSNHYGFQNIDELFEKTLKPLSYLLQSKYGESKTNILFTEYLGLNSFAGSHVDWESHKLIVLDVLTESGFVPPAQFSGDFGSGMYLSEENFPKILFSGNYSGQLVEDIRKGKYKVTEGAILKGVHKNQVYMAKVKTNAYMQLLKEKFDDKWDEYWE